MNPELLLIFGGIAFHIAWIGLIMSSFGKSVGWVIGVSLPYIGIPAGWAYTFAFWKSGNLQLRAFGALYFLSSVALLSGVLMTLQQGNNSEPNSQDSQTNEVVLQVQNLSDNPELEAEMEEEMKKMTLATNLGYIRSTTNSISGQWARLADNKIFELLDIKQSGSMLEATRITIDSRVPQGKTTWKLNTDTGEFSIQVAEEGFKNPSWVSGAITEFSTNLISVLPLYDENASRPFADENDLELIYIPNPIKPE